MRDHVTQVTTFGAPTSLSKSSAASLSLCAMASRSVSVRFGAGMPASVRSGGCPGRATFGSVSTLAGVKRREESAKL